MACITRHSSAVSSPASLARLVSALLSLRVMMVVSKNAAAVTQDPSGT